MMLHMSPSLNFNVNETDIRISESGYSRVDTSWRGEAENPPYSRLYYMIDGNGRITVDGQDVNLKKNNIYIIPAGKTINRFSSEFMDQLYFHINIYDFEGYEHSYQGNKDLNTRAHHPIYNGIQECRPVNADVRNNRFSRKKHIKYFHFGFPFFFY